MPSVPQAAENGWIAVTTVGDMLGRRAAADPAGEALVFPDHRCSYRDLDERADRWARGLLALGVRRGDRVGLLLPASADLVAGLFATARIGAIAVPVNARFKQVELEQIVVHSGMRVLVTAVAAPGTPDFVSLLTATFPPTAGRLSGAPELETVVVLGATPGDTSWAALSTEEFEAAGETIDIVTLDTRRAGVKVRDPALMVYTSGTTSAPKGALLSHEAVVRTAQGIGTRLRLTADDRVWTAIPLFHGGGLTFMFSSIAAGAPFVHPGFFDPLTTLPYLEAERVTIALAAFETIWMPVLDRPDFADHDLSRIRVVMAVGVPERLRVMASRLPGVTHVSCVAMTESCAFLSLNRLDDDPEHAMTTGGHPMPGMEVRVIDPDTGADLPTGTPGELLFRGPGAFDGYFRDPQLTAAAVDEGGWYHSGDRVVLDADGRLTFLSRIKDMLKVGGENVAAAEVEGHLIDHPAVALVAVVAAPDAYYGEVPAAFVQTVPGAEVTEQELIDHCVGRIATYRVPRYVRFVREWPMSGTKIRKVELRERIADELRAAGITEAPRISTPSTPTRA
ncbi:AMP-binding protein [Nakamurella sp. YIM 132087]|uniref:AMP-binding protein n=1 Tax=Nakamurella alba TaxID=2665158 RepID=A0A7K1FH46_9ACTN|nr:AMP-binding protein [Nakamurella alba]MTD13442.1 AMP-binding protein [Nakamurella alba]